MANDQAVIVPNDYQVVVQVPQVFSEDHNIIANAHTTASSSLMPSATTLRSPVTKVSACHAKTTVVVIHEENFGSPFDDCDTGQVRVECLGLDYPILIVLI
jgi:hypothetical protein